MQFPVFIKLHRSFLFSSSLLFAHVLAACCIVVLPWDVAVRALFLLAIVISAGYSLRPQKVSGLRLVAKDRIDAFDPEGRPFQIHPLPSTTVFNYLIVLRYTMEEEGARSMTLFPDQMTSKEFRLLRIWLGWRTINQVDG